MKLCRRASKTVHGGLVHDQFGNVLDGAGTGVAGSDGIDTFFRLFGDAEGDSHLHLGDLIRSRARSESMQAIRATCGTSTTAATAG